MKGDESANPPHQNNVPGFRNPPMQHLLTTAICMETFSAPEFKKKPTSEYVLMPYVAGGGHKWLKEKPLVCMLSILRSASVTHHTEERSRERTGAPCAYLGWWLWEIKGGCKGCNRSQHLSSTCLRAPRHSTFQTPQGFW